MKELSELHVSSFSCISSITNMTLMRVIDLGVTRIRAQEDSCVQAKIKRKDAQDFACAILGER